jgi:hypothetical protein
MKMRKVIRAGILLAGFLGADAEHVEHALLEPGVVDRLPGFRRRMEWFLNNNETLHNHIDEQRMADGRVRRLLSVVNLQRLTRVMRCLLDEEEFLSPCGIRALSRYHLRHPYRLPVNSDEHRVDYEPAESTTGVFGGNSNWRGPVWFPINYLLVEALERFHHFYGDDLRVECPTGSGQMMNLAEVAHEISERLARLFRPDARGERACQGAERRFAGDPHWQELVLFYEYFHGDTGRGLGASHQTGWTALVARLFEDFARNRVDVK